MLQRMTSFDTSTLHVEEDGRIALEYNHIQWHHAVNNTALLNDVLEELYRITYDTNDADVKDEIVVGIEIDIRMSYCLTKAVLRHDPYPEESEGVGGLLSGSVSSVERSPRDDLNTTTTTSRSKRKGGGLFGHRRKNRLPLQPDDDCLTLVNFFRLLVSSRWFTRRYGEIMGERPVEVKQFLRLVVKMDFKDPRAAVEILRALEAPQVEDSPYHSFYLLCKTLIVEAPCRNQKGKRELSVWYNADVVPSEQYLLEVAKRHKEEAEQQQLQLQEEERRRKIESSAEERGRKEKKRKKSKSKSRREKGKASRSVEPDKHTSSNSSQKKKEEEEELHSYSGREPTAFLGSGSGGGGGGEEEGKKDGNETEKRVEASVKVPTEWAFKGNKSLKVVYRCKSLLYTDLFPYELVDHIANFIKWMTSDFCEGFGLSFGWKVPDHSFTAYTLKDIAYMHYFLSLLYDVIQQYDLGRQQVELITLAVALDPFFPIPPVSESVGTDVSESDGSEGLDHGSMDSLHALLSSTEDFTRWESSMPVHDAPLTPVLHNTPLTPLTTLVYLFKFINGVYYRRAGHEISGESVRSFVTFWRYHRKKGNNNDRRQRSLVSIEESGGGSDPLPPSNTTPSPLEGEASEKKGKGKRRSSASSNTAEPPSKKGFWSFLRRKPKTKRPSESIEKDPSRGVSTSNNNNNRSTLSNSRRGGVESSISTFPSNKERTTSTSLASPKDEEDEALTRQIIIDEITTLFPFASIDYC